MLFGDDGDNARSLRVRDAAATRRGGQRRHQKRATAPRRRGLCWPRRPSPPRPHPHLQIPPRCSERPRCAQRPPLPSGGSATLGWRRGAHGGGAASLFLRSRPPGRAWPPARRRAPGRSSQSTKDASTPRHSVAFFLPHQCGKGRGDFLAPIGEACGGAPGEAAQRLERPVAQVALGFVGGPNGLAEWPHKGGFEGLRADGRRRRRRGGGGGAETRKER